jgi:hypothetical protein
MKKEEEEASAPKKKKKKKKNVFVFLLFFAFKNKKRKRERTGTLPDEQRSKEENGDPSIRMFLLLYSWPDDAKREKKKKRKEETRAHDVSDVIHCVCGGGGGAKGISERVTLLLPNPPTFFVE